MTISILMILAGVISTQQAVTIDFDGDSKQQSHWGYVLGIIGFILLLQAIGLGIEYWYKSKLNEFLAQTGQSNEGKTEDN